MILTYFTKLVCEVMKLRDVNSRTIFFVGGERDVDSDGAFQLFCSIRGLEVIDAFL